MRKVFSALAVLLLWSVPAYAGPFGTNMGDGVELFHNLENLSSVAEKKLYRTDLLPQSDPSFVEYRLTFGDSGLSEVAAFSKKYETRDGGEALLQAFDVIKKQLVDKYDEPNLEINRNYCRWCCQLPDNLSAIEMTTEPVGGNSYTVCVAFFYLNSKGQK